MAKGERNWKFVSPLVAVLEIFFSFSKILSKEGGGIDFERLNWVLLLLL